MQQILNYLRTRGERLDAEIATDTGISLENVRQGVARLSAQGEVIVCQSTRFKDGRKTEGWLCRIAGYIPPASPGRKAKPPVKTHT